MTKTALNYDFALSGLGCSNAADLPALPRHRWYFVKEAFSPVLVDRAMQAAACGQDDIVLDPFCGSGTSLLAAAKLDATPIGCEVNPFLAFVSRTKLSSIDGESLAKHGAAAQLGAEHGRNSPLEGNSTFTQAEGREKWLFNTEVIRSFEGGWSEIENAPASSRNALRLALIGAAMDCCNATQDGKCLRYRKGWGTEALGKDEFVARFESRLGHMQEDLAAKEASPSSGRVLLGDCRQTLNSPRIGSRFKLCVTSPPYLNSFDYSDIYRPEMFLGKFVCSAAELRAVRLKTVRSHVQASWKLPKEDDFGALYLGSIRSLRERQDALWDQRIPTMVQAYFEDMKRVLRLLRNHADENARLWVVVSTSAYAGIVIPVDLIIADIACKVGWRLEEVGVIRNLRSSGQHLNSLGDGAENLQLRESAVVLAAR